MDYKGYRICKRCIMDTSSDPNLELDENGICNYCRRYDKTIMDTREIYGGGEKALSALIDRIKKECRNKPFDCAVGISGGVDSCFVLHLCHQYGLRVLAVHVDCGWNSELAVQNIEKLCSSLKYDLQTEVIDWVTIKELQRAYMFSGLANQDVVQDHCFASVIRKYCKKNHIKYLMHGANFATEGILSTAYQQDPMDWINIKDVYRKYGRGKVSLKKYPHMSMLEHDLLYPVFSPVNVIYMLNYLEYSKKDAISCLEKEYGWKYYGGKHFESRFTRFYQEVYLPKKYGWEKKRDHISSLIVGGEMTREEGLKEMGSSTASREQLDEETEYVLKKLDISGDEWDHIISAPNRSLDEYRSGEKIKRTIKRCFRRL